MMTLEQLHRMLQHSEDAHLEFKAARDTFDQDKLTKYCVALANERGGKLILGVSDKQPRQIIGTKAFPNLEKIRRTLWDRLHMCIEATELHDPAGRVIIFEIPSRPIGRPVEYDGAYWMRLGEDLHPMPFEQLMLIASEAEPDFSAEECRAASMTDLDSTAIERFRTLWVQKSGNRALLTLAPDHLLTDAELLVDGVLTNAALILLGTRLGLGKHLPQAEVIFEYHSSDASLPAQQRVEFRQGFFTFDDELWYLINLRNDIQQYQSNLVRFDIATFNEVVVREALLNAISHREYRLQGSVFVREYPRRLEIISPGGFPSGITTENILIKQFPRNRRIAEAFNKCGLIERSGQGMNRMFEECIKESKPTPDFTGTDDYQVAVTLRGEVQDPQFLRFLEQVGKERLASFTTQDFLLLDAIHHEQKIPNSAKSHLDHLQGLGIIERRGRGRYMLTQRFYRFIGQQAAYTRKKGLDRETNKMLLLKHIQDNATEGCRLEELTQVLPSLPSYIVKDLLQELKKDGRIINIGRTKGARWYPVSVESKPI